MEIHAIKSAASHPVREDKSQLSQLFSLMQAIQAAMHNNQRDLFDVVREDLDRYKQESQNLSDTRNWQGWSVATLTLVGAFLLGVSPYIDSLKGFDKDFETLITELGGVEAVKKLCDTSSQFSRGMEPVLNVWSEGKVSATEVNKHFMQNAYSQGQSAAEHSNQFVYQIAKNMQDLLDKESDLRRFG
ncbi:MAG: hypothetical protein RLZZ453_220 [Chlamydiota bacterium]|jgi:hypothetical protein